MNTLDTFHTFHPLNTHTYDHSIPPLPISFTLLFSNTNKIIPIQNLRSHLSHPLSLHFFDQIVIDHYNPPNFDQTNNLSAYDLLYLIALHFENIDIPSLSEQLQDMSTGFCPQGRTIRLYQIIYSLLPQI